MIIHEGTEVNFVKLQVNNVHVHVPRDSMIPQLACSSCKSESATCCTLAATHLQRREVSSCPSVKPYVRIQT